jgi:hypothetical protein
VAEISKAQAVVDARAALLEALSSEDEVWVTLDQRFPLSERAWRDIMAQLPTVRDALIADMVALGGLSWSKKPDAWPAVLSALTFLASIANPVTAIVGGIEGLASLPAALKAV